MPRKPGTPKTGGRKKGSLNKNRPEFRELLEQYENGKGFDPVTEMLDIIVATKFDNPLASLKGCTTLIDRMYPSLKAVEHTGKDGGPIQVTLESLVTGSIKEEK